MWEEIVNDTLLSRGINTIDKLNIRELSDAFNAEVYYWKYSSRIIKKDGIYYCLLNNQKNKIQRYREFLHEISHVIYDEELTVVNNKKVHEFMEIKVDSLVPYVAIPKFAISEARKMTLEEITEHFHVPYDIALKRMTRLFYKDVNHYESCALRSRFY